MASGCKSGGSCLRNSRVCCVQHCVALVASKGAASVCGKCLRVYVVAWPLQTPSDSCATEVDLDARQRQALQQAQGPTPMRMATIAVPATRVTASIGGGSTSVSPCLWKEPRGCAARLLNGRSANAGRWCAHAMPCQLAAVSSDSRTSSHLCGWIKALRGSLVHGWVQTSSRCCAPSPAWAGRRWR